VPIKIAYEWKAKGTKEMARSNSKEIRETILKHADNLGKSDASDASKEKSKKALKKLWPEHPKIFIACYMKATKSVSADKFLIESDPGKVRINGIKDAFFACLQEKTINGEDFLTKLLENRKIKKSVARFVSRPKIYDGIKALEYKDNKTLFSKIARFLLKTNIKAAYSKAEDFINHTLTKKIAKGEYTAKQTFAREIDEPLYNTKSKKIKDKKTLLVNVSGFARRHARRHPLEKGSTWKENKWGKILNALRSCIPRSWRTIHIDIDKDLFNSIKKEINKIGSLVAGKANKDLTKRYAEKLHKTSASSAPNRNATVGTPAVATRNLRPISRKKVGTPFTSPASSTLTSASTVSASLNSSILSSLTSPSASTVSTSLNSSILSSLTSPSASTGSTSLNSSILSSLTSPSASTGSNSLNSSILSSLTSPSASTGSNSPASISSKSNHKAPPVNLTATLAVSLFHDGNRKSVSSGDGSLRAMEQSL